MWMWCYSVGSIFCHCQGIQDHFGLLYVVCVVMQQWCVACILWHLDYRHSPIACYMTHNSVSCRAAFQAHRQSIQPLERFCNRPNSLWKCTYPCAHNFFLYNGNKELCVSLAFKHLPSSQLIEKRQMNAELKMVLSFIQQHTFTLSLNAPHIHESHTGVFTSYPWLDLFSRCAGSYSLCSIGSLSSRLCPTKLPHIQPRKKPNVMSCFGCG